MRFNPEIHHRRSIRLKGYDYSAPGAYYFTTVVHDRQHELCSISAGCITLTKLGWVVQHVWDELPDHYQNVKLEAFVIMPNHIHGVMLLSDANGEFDVVGVGWRDYVKKKADFPGVIIDTDALSSTSTNTNTGEEKPAPTPMGGTKRASFTQIMSSFKTYTSRRINAWRGATGMRFWQQNYYEHVVRNEQELSIIRRYIEQNPVQWRTNTLFGNET